MATRGLFRRRPQRSAAYAGLAMLFAYLAQRWVPSTPFARVIAEMVVAFVSLTAFSLFVVAHHRSGIHGRIMNQTQEEVMLIFLYGLFWFAFLIGIKAWNDRHLVGQMDASRSASLWVPSASRQMHSGHVQACPGGTFMCVMENMSW